jgi:hypothetical protein
MISVDAAGLNGKFSNPVGVAPDISGPFRAIPAQPQRDVSATLSLAWDRSNGPHRNRLYLAYMGTATAGDTTTNDTNIYVRFSDDSGKTFSAPVLVNDDTTTFSQFFPHIALDQSTGNVALAWYDCRNDPGSGPGDTDGIPNTDVEVFGSASLDGGVTWLPNVQVALGPSNAIAAGDNFGNDFGDYIGNTFVNNVFYPCWADNSKQVVGNPDLPNFDVVVAAVAVPTVPPGPPAPPPPVFLPEDRFEPNDTSDKATDMGALIPGVSDFPNLTINTHRATGLPDYDWYKWLVGQTGTVTVTITYSGGNGGQLALKLYKLNAQNQLVQLASSETTGQGKQVVSAPVNFADDIYVEVFGMNHGEANYDMNLNLQ